MPDYRVYMPCSRTWVDPFDIKSTDAISIPDIARKLSRIFRFGGSSPITVAQHCIMVAEAVEDEHKPYALLHDAFEALTFDVPRPVKPRTGFQFGADFVSYDEMEYRGLCRILQIFDILPHIPSEVREADDRACQLEYHALIAGGYDYGVQPMSSDQAFHAFITAWALCGRGVAA